MSHAPAHAHGHPAAPPPTTRGRGSPGPCSGSPWPPRSSSSWTSPWSTPPCPASVAPCTWVAATSSGSTAYVMMSGGGLLLGGRISDLLSRRGVFLTGLALFTVASLVSGFADSGAQLIAARAVQGLSAALLTPSALSLITTTYAGSQRRPHSPCGERSAASASLPASSSAEPSPPGPAGSTSSGSTSPSVSSPWPWGSASSPRGA